MVNRRFDHIIFDLDGTLIDSAPAILACFERLLERRGIPPNCEIDSRLIGPPLVETLAQMSGEEDSTVLQSMAAEFKNDYDKNGVFETSLYPGVKSGLLGLLEAGVRVHIATNKRLNPASLILQNLGILDYFDTVYALDRCIPSYLTKASMIGAQLFEQNLPLDRTCYIGDKLEDGRAADENALIFYAANWGYGEWGGPLPSPRWKRIASPENIIAIICS